MLDIQGEMGKTISESLLIKIDPIIIVYKDTNLLEMLNQFQVGKVSTAMVTGISKAINNIDEHFSEAVRMIS
jgi:CBS domain containing-hemolysin-like protein